MCASLDETVAHSPRGWCSSRSGNVLPGSNCVCEFNSDGLKRMWIAQVDDVRCIDIKLDDLQRLSPSIFVGNHRGFDTFGRRTQVEGWFFGP